MSDQMKTRGWRFFTALNIGIFVAGVAAIAVSMARVSDANVVRSFPSSRKHVTLNAFDYRQRIYSFLRKSFGTSRQVDKDFREYVGELYFTGRELTLLENDIYSGVLIDLGRDVQPDSEFSVFYGLRVYKRHFQMPQFPYQDHFRSYNEIDRSVVFGRPTDGHLSVGIGLGHTYLLRPGPPNADRRREALRAPRSRPHAGCRCQLHVATGRDAQQRGADRRKIAFGPPGEGAPRGRGTVAISLPMPSLHSSRRTSLIARARRRLLVRRSKTRPRRSAVSSPSPRSGGSPSRAAQCSRASMKEFMSSKRPFVIL